MKEGVSNATFRTKTDHKSTLGAERDADNASRHRPHLKTPKPRPDDNNLIHKLKKAVDLTAHRETL